MKKLLAIAALIPLMACQAQPVYAPPTAQVSTLLESADLPPGSLFPLDIFVFDGISGDLYNNVIVEVWALGSMVFPSEAIGGTSNQIDPETGESQVSWCDPEILSEAELEACVQDYYFQVTSVDTDLGANYARLVTDRYGTARIYVVPFCQYDIDSDQVLCAPSDSEGLVSTISVSIRVDTTVIPITYN